MKHPFPVIFMALILFACQSESQSTHISETFLPSNTPVPVETATQIPTTTIIIPTSTISANNIEQEAATLCEQASSAPVQSGTFSTPYLGMWKMEWADVPTWNISNSIPHLFALSKESVKNIICVSDSRRQVGIYTDGSAAFQIIQNVRIVSWPEGIVLGSKRFEGGPPPEKRNGIGGGYGPYPTEVRPWIFEQLGEMNYPNFLFLPSEESGSAIALSSGGSLLALSVSVDNGSSKIMLFDIQNLQIISSWNIAVEKINDLIFSPDGAMLISAGSDTNIFFWDTQTGNEIGNIDLPSAVYLIKYSPDGKLIAASTTTDLYLFEPTSLQLNASYSKIGNTFSFSPDGRTIYTDEGSLEALTGNLIHKFYDYNLLVPTISVNGDVSFDTGLPDFISNFDLAPTGEYGVSYSFTSTTDGITVDTLYTLSIIDVNTWKETFSIPFSSISFDMLGFSPDGKFFAVGLGSEIQLLNTQTWEVSQALIGHTGRILDVAFSVDSKNIISLSTDNTIRVWSLNQ